jgi:hypothetical protein
MIEPTTRLNPAIWGRFTVIKPNLGARGANIRLRRTKDVRWWPPQAPHYIPFLAQRFIDTGPFFESYRVMTVLSKPTYSRLSRSITPRPTDLDLTDKPINLPIASNVGAGGTVELRIELDVVALAVKAASAFPEVPALGVDLLRQKATGKLFVIEVNASGLVWHLSSSTGKKSQSDFGVDYYSQFGALDVIADALIDVTGGMRNSRPDPSANQRRMSRLQQTACPLSFARLDW